MARASLICPAHYNCQHWKSLFSVNVFIISEKIPIFRMRQPCRHKPHEAGSFEQQSFKAVQVVHSMNKVVLCYTSRRHEAAPPLIFSCRVLMCGAGVDMTLWASWGTSRGKGWKVTLHRPVLWVTGPPEGVGVYILNGSVSTTHDYHTCTVKYSVTVRNIIIRGISKIK